jgi:hypothetical protein
MFVVCDETAEQAKRTRAEKEGKMKELLEQYKHITHQATILVQVTEHSTITPDTRLGDALHTINSKADLLAHDIISELQQEIDAAAKYLNESKPEHKPLWAVVPVDADDDCWRRNRGAFKQLRYYMFTNRQDAEDHKSDGFKAVPVWGE